MKLKCKDLKQVVIVASVTLLVGCGGGSNSSSSTKSDNAKLLLEVSAKEMKSKLIFSGWDIGDLKVYGYKAYKISYVTKDEKDKNVNVSGLFVVPTNIDEEMEENGLSMVSYGHGTIVENDKAPSVFTEKNNSPIASAIIFSSLGGFATLQADYIGYGDSLDHYHPYVMKKSLANSSIDFIDAVKVFAEQNQIKLNEKLFLSGYSEGGYTAMATLQKLEEKGIKVTAAAPLAGAYDLNYEAKASLGLFDEDLIGFSSTYFALSFLAYTKVYDKNISMIMNTPYGEQIETLLDGKHSVEQIEQILPPKAYGENGLLTNSFVEDYINSENHWLKNALKENSVDDWKPKTPVHIVHCQGDDQVAYTIAQNTYNKMINNGATDVELITPDREEAENKKWNHSECYFPSLKLTTLWFVEMRDK